MSQTEQLQQSTWSAWPNVGASRAGVWLRGLLNRPYSRVESSDIENQISDSSSRSQQELQVRQTQSEPQPQGTSSASNTSRPGGDQGNSSSQLDPEIAPLVQGEVQQEQGSSSLEEGQEDGGLKGIIHRFSGKKLSSLNLQGRSGSYQRLPTSGSDQQRAQGQAQCLICFEPLTSEDFKTNKAIILQCNCRGDVAYRHRECAEKWAKIKGNNVCDVCKAPIHNIQPPPPAEDTTLNLQDDLNNNIEHFRNDQLRSIEQTWVTDFNWFDCVRVAWIVMIVCMVSFDFSLQRAVAAGMLSGLLYLAIRYCLVVIYVRQEQWALFNAINSYINQVHTNRNDDDQENQQQRSNDDEQNRTSSAESSPAQSPRHSQNNGTQRGQSSTVQT